MRRLFQDGGSVTVSYEPAGLRGRPCIAVYISMLGLTLRVALQDAESLGEALIQQVRRGEEAEPPCQR